MKFVLIIFFALSFLVVSSVSAYFEKTKHNFSWALSQNMKIKSVLNTESKVIYIFEPNLDGEVYMCIINIFGEVGNNSICFKEKIE